MPRSRAWCRRHPAGRVWGSGADPAGGEVVVSDTLQVRPEHSRTGDGTLMSIVYGSTATVPFSEADLALLMTVSRTNNEPLGLTGLLLHRDGQFMQALEGPERAVRTTLARIAADPRHTGVWTLAEEPITARRFGSWAMGYRGLSDAEVYSAPAWFGSEQEALGQDDSRAGALLAWFRDR